MRDFKNKVSNAYFNIIDIKNTLDKESKSLPRRHGGTANSDTVGELIDDVKLFIENLLNEVSEIEQDLWKNYVKHNNSRRNYNRNDGSVHCIIAWDYRWAA